MYQHTQVSYLNLIVGAGLTLVFVAVGRPATAAGVVALLSVLVWTIFGTLSTSVQDRALHVRFGPLPLVRKRLALADITSASVVRNSPLYGWGVRYIPRGTLWNVWGLNAVELQLKNGKCFRVGTDEPQALVAALRQRGVSA